jgi:ribosomal protein L32E
MAGIFAWLKSKLRRRPVSTITVADAVYRRGDLVTIYLPSGPITRRVSSVDSGTTLTIEKVGLMARLWAWIRRKVRRVFASKEAH